TIDKEKIIWMYQNNIAIADIKERLGYSAWAIRYTLKKLGFIPKRLVSNKKTLISNEFSFLDYTPKKCFALGVIFGDGHVGKNDVTIYSSLKDIDIINSINELFDNK